MADITKIRIQGTSYTVKDETARKSIQEIQNLLNSGKLNVKVTKVTTPTTQYPKIIVDDDINAVASKTNKYLSDLKNLHDESVGNFLLQRNTDYEVGAVAYSPNLPAWCRLVCIQAGRTDSVEPSEFKNINNSSEI